MEEGEAEPEGEAEGARGAEPTWGGHRQEGLPRSFQALC